MAVKKKTIKTASDSQTLPKPSKTKKLLGMEASQIGRVIATAVVAELAQAAIKQALKSDSATDVEETVKGNAAKTNSASLEDSAKHSANSLKESAIDNPAIQNIVGTLKTVIDEAKPVIAEAINGARSAPEAVSSAVSDTASDTIGKGKDLSGDTAQFIEDAVRRAIAAAAERVGATQFKVKEAADETADTAKTKLEAVKASTVAPQKGKKAKKAKRKRKAKKG